MNLKLINFSVSPKSSDVLSEAFGVKWRKFSKKINYSRSEESIKFENDNITSKQEEKCARYFTQVVYKIIKLTPVNTEGIYKTKYVKKSKYERDNFFDGKSADSWADERNKKSSHFIRTHYTVLKRSMSTYSNSYCTSTPKVEENIAFKSNKNVKKILNSSKYKIIVSPQNSLVNKPFLKKPFDRKESFKQRSSFTQINSSQSIEKYHKISNTEYKVIKRSKSALKSKDQNAKESFSPVNSDNVSMDIAESIATDNSSSQVIKNANDEKSKKCQERANEINLQMLPVNIYKQLFPEGNKQPLSSEKAASLKEQLEAFGLNVDKQMRLADVNIEIPALEGKDLEEHFHNIASVQVKPYLKALNELTGRLPPLPENWILQEGWTRYTETGSEKVDYPSEDGLIFDVEVCMSEGPLPTLATAIIMSQATKRKHVFREVEEDLSLPAESQSIVQLIESRGNNLHEAMNATGDRFLISMPPKFRKNVWVHRGHFVIIDPIPEGDKVRGEIVRILRKEHIKFFRSQNCWPKEFEQKRHESTGDADNEEEEESKDIEEKEEDDLFVNTNRPPVNHDTTETESDSSTEASDSD